MVTAAEVAGRAGLGRSTVPRASLVTVHQDLGLAIRPSNARGIRIPAATRLGRLVSAET
jgi:hypothetical protein